MKTILQGTPSNKSTSTPLKDVDFNELMSSFDLTDFWTYNGSWTNPPCTEGIKWALLKEV